MWSKMTLRIKITVLATLALSFVAVSITLFSFYTPQNHFGNLEEALDLELEGSNAIILQQIDGSPLELPEELAGLEALVNEMTRAMDESQLMFRRTSIMVAILFVVGGSFGVYLITLKALRPLESLTEKMEKVDENNLTLQIKPPKAEDEVAQLTHTFNSMLEKLNRSFETQKLFAQNAAHEFKTPLAFVRASLDLLQMDEHPTEKDYKETYEIVQQSNERLIELVEGLLSLHCLVDEQRWQTFDGQEMFEEIFNELREEIKQKEITVSISGDCALTGDKILLGRAFANLIHNAIRYNRSNGIVNIILKNGKITIEDSGIGIPAENMPHIFDPFYCVDKSRSKKLGGSGLGMAIAKSILDKHHVGIEIFSQMDEGTKISLTQQS